MIYDMIVVGAGYWGAACASEARRRGRTVLVIDDADPKSGSRAASGVCDPKAYKSDVFAKYLPADWKPLLNDSFQWLLDNGGVLTTERFRNHFAGTESRGGAECVYVPTVDTILSLAGETVRAGVVGGSLGETVCVSGTDGRAYVGRRLLVAAGYRTDDVLRSVGVKPLGVGRLYGRGILAAGTPREAVPVSVMIKPYVKHTVRPWGAAGSNVYKVGDTAEERPNDKLLEGLRTVGRLVLSGYREAAVTEGYRPVLPQFTVEKVGRNCVVATGGHRLGLGLCGLVARKVEEALS